jgi:hypothetical protein
MYIILVRGGSVNRCTPKHPGSSGCSYLSSGFSSGQNIQIGTTTVFSPLGNGIIVMGGKAKVSTRFTYYIFQYIAQFKGHGALQFS